MISGGLFYCLNAFENFIKTLILLSITVLSHRIPFLFYRIFSHQQNRTEQVNQNTNRQKIFGKLLVKIYLLRCDARLYIYNMVQNRRESITRYTLKEVF